MTETLVWAGIIVCVSQSAIFSGLNLAIFSLSRLNLEIEAERGQRAARRVLALRQDANFALTTILWGNVGINVLLTLLSDSVLTGLSAFLFPLNNRPSCVIAIAAITRVISWWHDRESV